MRPRTGNSDSGTLDIAKRLHAARAWLHQRLRRLLASLPKPDVVRASDSRAASEVPPGERAGAAAEHGVVSIN
jgi:hypothetical protein